MLEKHVLYFVHGVYEMGT